MSALVILALFSSLYAVYRLSILLLQVTSYRKMLFALPHEQYPRAVGLKLDFLGAFKRKIGKEEESNYIALLQKYGIGYFKQCYSENQDRGIFVNMWASPSSVLVYPLATVLVTGVDEFRKLLSFHYMDSLRKGRGYHFLRDLLGDGILISDAEVWHRQREVFDTGLSLLNHGTLVESIVRAHLQRLATSIDEGKESNVDILLLSKKVVIDILGQTLLGYKLFETKNNDRLLDNMHTICKKSPRISFHPKLKILKFLPWCRPQDNTYDEALGAVNVLVEAIILKQQSTQSLQDKPCNLVQVLLSSSNQEISKQQVRDNIKTLLLAGHDTTANAITWILYLLSKHSNVLQKLRSEISQITLTATVDSIQSVPYLKAIILETLRLYPSAMFTRITKRKIQIDEFVLPRGVEILFIPSLFQTDEKYFKDATEFIPERWIRHTDLSRPLHTILAVLSCKIPYFPFSVGRRNCAGKKFALLELQLLSFYFVDLFEIEEGSHGPKFQAEPYIGATLSPKDIYIKLIPRKTS